ncbi:MAG: hypothetical protein WCS28_03410 [Thiomicrospira sp.]
MVKNRRLHNRALLSILLGLCVLISAQASRAQQLMLGESLTLTLRSAHTQHDYQALDLSALRAWAHIDDSQQNNERIRLRLTPYSSGTFDIPPLRAGGLVIEPQRITVTPNPTIDIHWQPPKQQAWQGEWVSWRIQVHAQDSGLPLTLDSTQTENVVFSSQPIAQHLGDDKRAEFVLTQALNQIGTHSLARPLLVVQNRQGGRWFFYPPPHTISVRPLPSYLPADIGVGHYQLEVKRPFWLSQGELQHHTLTLSATNSNQRPDPRTWLQHPSGFEWLTPQRDTSQTLNTQGIVLRQTLSQPFRPPHIDWGIYPPIRLTLFNPDTGLLEDQTWPAQPYLVLPFWLQLIVYLIGLLALFAAIRGLLNILRRLGHRLILHYRVKQAQGDPLAIWQAYQSWGVTLGLGEQPTHQTWLSAYQRRFGENPALQHLFNQLDQARYAKTDAKTDANNTKPLKP